MAEIAIESATQGHTMRDDEDCCAAAHAVDKDLSTPASTHTDNGAGWLKLKFGRTHFVHKIVIYSRFFTNWFRPSNDCVKDEANFKGCVDNDKNVDVSVYQGEEKQKSCGTLQLKKILYRFAFCIDLAALLSAFYKLISNYQRLLLCVY